MGVTDVLIDLAFVKLIEVGFREDGVALGLVHGGAEQVFHIMYRRGTDPNDGESPAER